MQGRRNHYASRYDIGLTTFQLLKEKEKEKKKQTFS